MRIKYTNYHSALTDEKFILVATSLQAKWPELFNINKRSLLVKLWMKKFGDERVRRFDYNKLGMDFNRAYFLKNLYKSLAVLSYIKDQKEEVKIKYLPVIDVGCGIGNFSIAWSFLGHDQPGHIKLIDKSDTQLAEAKKTARLLCLSRRKYFNDVFPGRLTHLPGLRLMSYWLCEGNNLNLLDNEQGISQIVGDGAIIIDYIDVVRQVKLKLKKKYFVKSWSLQLELNSKIYQFLRERFIKVHVCYCRPY